MIFGEFLKKCTKFEAVGTAPLNQFRENFFMPRNRFSAYKSFPAKIQIFTFSLQYTVFPESGQGKVFSLRECAQSIPRTNLPPIWSFLEKNFPVQK